MSDERIVLQLEGESQELKSDLRRAERMVQGTLRDVEQQSASSAKRSASSMGTIAKGAVAGIAAGIAAGGIQAALGSIQAATVGVASAFSDMAEEVFGAIDQMGTLEQATGFSQRTLHGLQLIAEQTNKELEELIPKDLSKRILEASQGMGEGLPFIQAFGIEVQTATGELRSADDVLKDMIDALSTIPDPTTRSATAVKLLGEEGKNLFSAFSSVEDLERAEEAAARFGISGLEAADASAEWWRATGTLTRAMTVLQGTLVTELGGTGVAVMREMAVSTVFLAALIEELSDDVVDFVGHLATAARAFAPVTAGLADVAVVLAGAVVDAASDGEGALAVAIQRAEEFRSTFEAMGESAEGMVGPVKTWSDELERATGAGREGLEGVEGALEAVEAEQQSLLITSQEFLAAYRQQHEEATDRVTMSWSEASDEISEDMEDAGASIEETFRGVVDILGQAADIVGGYLELSLDRQVAASQESIREAEQSGDLTRRQIRELRKEEEAAVMQAFRRTQALQRVAAVIDAARAAISMIPGFAFLGPFAPAAAAGAAAAALGIQLSTINAQQPPSFPSGGTYSTDGASAGHGLAYLEGGEGIVNRRAMSDPATRELVERLNSGQRMSGGSVQVVVSYDSRMRRLRIEPARQPLGKRQRRR